MAWRVGRFHPSTLRPRGRFFSLSQLFRTCMLFQTCFSTHAVLWKGLRPPLSHVARSGRLPWAGSWTRWPTRLTAS